MLSDRKILCSVILIASFNLSVFTLYQLAPFIWASTTTLNGLGGFMGIGVLLGSLLNQVWLAKKTSLLQKLTLAICLNGLGSLMLYLFDHELSQCFMLVLIMMAYAIAIPNLLAQALQNYQHVAGTAGALLGLGYYSLLGLGLILTSEAQHLAGTLVVNTVISGIVCLYLRWIAI